MLEFPFKAGGFAVVASIFTLAASSPYLRLFLQFLTDMSSRSKPQKELGIAFSPCRCDVWCDCGD